VAFQKKVTSHGPQDPRSYGTTCRPRTGGWRSCCLWCSRRGEKAGGAARRGGHGVWLPPAGWRLRQELQGLGRLHVLAHAAGGLASSSPSIARCPRSRSVSSPHRPVSSPLTPPLILIYLWSVKLIQNFNMMQGIPWFLGSWSIQS
jgi:hypothetical protein